MPKNKHHGGLRPGAGRPRIYQELGAPISVRLEKTVQDALEAKVVLLGISRTQGLQAAVAKYVKAKK